MAYPLSHKTVFVLDHSPYFAEPSGEIVELEVQRNKSGLSSLPSPMKSVWTVNVESVLEYYRIARDLFPDRLQKVVRFVVSDSVGRFLTETWSETEQQTDKMLASFARCGAPNFSGDLDSCCILNGLSLAIEALSQSTAAQKQARKHGSHARAAFKNRGRIVCITRLKDDEEVQMILDHVRQSCKSRNNSIKKYDENLLPIHELDVCIVNTRPIGQLTLVSETPTTAKVDDLLSYSIHNSLSGHAMHNKLRRLVLEHFNLASTTVTCIPMKEEQNTGASMSYDVELFHNRDVHSELDRGGYLNPNTGSGLTSQKPEGYRTILLKWTTPNMKPGQSELFRLCSQAFRMTPVEVNSRPSACLSGFLLAGRTVVLELPAKILDIKSASHMLTCHGGQLYIHTLWNSRSILEDPPSIAEGPGGKVADYRTAHLAEFLKECLLIPSESPLGQSGSDPKVLNQITQFWPLTYNDSAMFSLGSTKLEPLPTILRKALINEQEITQCKAILYHLHGLQSSGELLSNPSAAGSVPCTKLRGLNIDDQYKLLWDELEAYIRQFAHYSSNHLFVLNCLLQIASRPLETWPNVTKGAAAAMAVDLGPPVEERAARKRKEEVRSASVEEMFDGPESPSDGEALAPAAKRPRAEVDFEGRPTEKKINLYKFWLDKYEKQYWSKWKDFEGRLACKGGDKAELYQDLFKKDAKVTKFGCLNLDDDQVKPGLSSTNK